MIEKPPIYKFLEETSKLDIDELYNTFNMGIGMMLVVDAQDSEKVLAALHAADERAYVIGEIVAGNKGVILCQD